MEDLWIGRRAIPRAVCDRALRRLYVDVLERGLPAETLAGWIGAANHFPHLRDAPEITALASHLPAELRVGVPCEPQILVGWPHTGDDEPEITWHTDVEPPWADGRRYARIVGVPLTTWSRETGGLIVRLSERRRDCPVLHAGDAIAMAPYVEHSGGINRSPTPRVGVYFRWLAE